MPISLTYIFFTHTHTHTYLFLSYTQIHAHTHTQLSVERKGAYTAPVLDLRVPPHPGMEGLLVFVGGACECVSV
jgi:hypothetical protein